MTQRGAGCWPVGEGGKGGKMDLERERVDEHGITCSDRTR